MTKTPFQYVALPLVMISVLLFGLGVAAAWNVQEQQVNTSEVVHREVESMVVMQDLYITMREIRRLLDLCLRTTDTQYLSRVAEYDASTREALRDAARLARTPEEQGLVAAVATGYEHFAREFDALALLPDPSSVLERVAQLNDVVLSEEILTPARQCVEFNRRIVDRTNEANRRTTDQMRQGFLLLGVAGGSAGVIAGIVLARSMQRSILELKISVEGAAGKLREVLDPIPVTTDDIPRSWQGIIADIDGHVIELVERLQQREREVLRNEQLGAIGQLAAGMAHELRNPLMPIKMLVQSALQRDEGLKGRTLKVIDEEITRLETSIRDFLEFARPPLPEPVDFDFRDALTQTLALVTPRATGQSVTIASVLPDTPCQIHADPTQIRQVLLNLLLNSLDELHNGGQIELRLTPLGTSDHSHPPPGLADSWLLRIEDSGPGFDAAIADRIFEPFVSNKETGTGLGLCICRRIVEAHGGTIEAHNGAAGGACFEIVLPAGTPPADPAGQPPATRAPATGQGPRAA